MIRGCASVVLAHPDASSRPSCNRRLGYTEVGRFDDFPVGHGQVMFQKRLTEETPGP